MQRLIPTAMVLLVSILLGSCSQPGGGGAIGSTSLPANPSGVLLDGDPDGLAHLALQDMTPTAVPPADVVAGLMTIRLEAQVDSAATVGELNAALAASSAAIVSMHTGFPIVTLVIPAVADVAEATALANDLVATGAFALATPCYAPGADTGVALWDGDSSDPFAAWEPADGQSLGDVLAVAQGHLVPLRMPAAKNAMSLSAMNVGYLPVLVPDDYSSLVPDARIAAQDFLPGPGIAAPGQEGNNGFAACGLIGIDPGYANLEAVHPSPADDLWLWSLALGGLTWIERVAATAELAPAAGNFVLHTGFNYDPFYSTRTKTWRIYDAVAWRYFADQDAPRFVHLTAAGNWGQIIGEAATAAWQSPFALSDAFDFLGDEVPQDDTTAYNDILLAIGGEPVKLDNLRIVGSSNPVDYQSSVYASAGSDLRVLGENILAPCVDAGFGCNGSEVTVTSTATASAQVAGLFSYLWSLAPTRSNDDLLDIVDQAWFGGGTPGLVDAYYATLALDPSIFDARVREALLDVAANLDVADALGNGMFDHHDLKVFLDAFDGGGGQRYDLNGDGIVGGQSVALFDLDVNSPPSIGTASLDVEGQMIDFTEAALTDLEILCYYAYSALYDGSTTARTTLLSECNGVPQSGIFILSSERWAWAYTDASAGLEDLIVSLDTSNFNAVADFSDTSVIGSSTGQTSSSTTHNSDYVFDEYGNLILLEAGGAGVAAMSLTNPAGWSPLNLKSHSMSFTDLRFQVVGEDVGFELTVNANGSWAGDLSIGEDAYVEIDVHLKDTGGTEYIDYLFETPGDTLPASLTLQGVLPGDSFGGDFILEISILSHASFIPVAGTAPPAQVSASAINTWDFEFKLTP